MNQSDFDPSYPEGQIESKIVASLERIAQSFRVLLWQESKALSLSPIQIQVLIFLLSHSEHKRKVSYLAEEFDLTKATLSDTIKTLEQKGLITKIYDPKDTRSYVIHLTETGRNLAYKTAFFANEIRTPIEQLPEASKEDLLQNLLHIISHLHQVGVITLQRMCFNCVYYLPASGENLPYCKLLNQSLLIKDLRIDCPEHELKVI